MDDWLGPTLALVHCSECQQPAVIHLLAWTGDQLARRVFAIREVSKQVAETYLHNISRDYCDLTRKGSETEALIQASDEAVRIVIATAPNLQIEQSISAEAVSLSPTVRPWQEIDSADFERWLSAISNPAAIENPS